MKDVKEVKVKVDLDKIPLLNERISKNDLKDLSPEQVLWLDGFNTALSFFEKSGVYHTITIKEEKER